MDIFNTLFYKPIYNALIFLYENIGTDLGISIIVLTVLIKVALLGLSKKQISSQKEMQEIQPKIKELQKKYKKDKERLAKETMALYKEHKINPVAGCLPLIVQMVIFITLYRVIINLAGRDEFRVIKEDLYSFVPYVEKIHDVFLPGIINMNLASPSYFLAIVTAIAQYYQIRMMQERRAANKSETQEVEKKVKKDGDKPDMADFATIMQKQMLVIIPVMTLVIGFTFPAGLTLYWLTSTLFMIGQQYVIMKGTK